MIHVVMTKYNLEHDLYALVRSFYPGVETNVEVLETEEDECYVNLEGGEIGNPIRILLREADLYAGQSRLEFKTYVKTKVYEALSAHTGKSLAWGTLTGIRPTKLAMEQLENQVPEEQVETFLKEKYLVSDQKAALCVEIAQREKTLLSQLDYQNGYSLYIGIPFCPTRCLYCSFTSYPIDKWADRTDEYTDRLCEELDFVFRAMKGKKLDTVYMGGGTPTTLSPLQMDRVLSKVSEYAGALDHLKEFTVEAGRPDSITREKLQVIYDHGISRISINPQTMQQKTLDLIGRRHSVEQIYDAYALAREIGFENINMDLIVGLPGETYEDVADTMRQIGTLSPDSLTVHSLAIKRAARLNTMKEQYEQYKITNTQEIIDMTEGAARAMGLVPYYLYRQKNMAGNFENVGYAKVDKAGIYNILIMEEKQSIIACGAGGSTKIVIPEENRIERIENVKDVGTYLDRFDEMIERKEKWLCH